MAAIKEFWEKANLPLMDDDNYIVAAMEKVKKEFDKKKRNKNIKELDKVQFLAYQIQDLWVLHL